MRSRTRTRLHLDFSGLALGRGADERRPFSPRPLELLKNSHLNSVGKDLFDLLRVSECSLPVQQETARGNIIARLQSVMFTCMDITMAPGGQGGGWLILRTDLRFLCPDWWISSKRKIRESISQWVQNKSLLS